MTTQKWTYEAHTSALADTGDYESVVTFTNGKDVLQSCGEEMSDKQCVKFCKLLNKMPDLWSHSKDSLEFENSQFIKKIDCMKSALSEICDPIKFLVDRLKDGAVLNGVYACRLSTDANYLKQIASDALKKIDSL